jgi:hypothetical protein
LGRTAQPTGGVTGDDGVPGGRAAGATTAGVK